MYDGNDTWGVCCSGGGGRDDGGLDVAAGTAVLGMVPGYGGAARDTAVDGVGLVEDVLLANGRTTDDVDVVLVEPAADEDDGVEERVVVPLEEVAVVTAVAAIVVDSDDDAVAEVTGGVLESWAPVPLTVVDCGELSKRGLFGSTL